MAWSTKLDKSEVPRFIRGIFVFVGFVVLIFCSSALRAATVPLASIDSERVTNPMESGIFSWNASFDIGFDATMAGSGASGTFNVGLDLYLFPLGGASIAETLVDTWEQGIESIWSSGQFQVAHEDLFFYDVNLDVNFVDVLDPSIHHLVFVSEGTGPTNMTHWYTENPSGWPQDKQDEVAAHEVGHMLGNYDEYPSGAVNPDGSYNNVYDSVMGAGLTQSLFPRHYDFIVDWIEAKEPTTEFHVVASASPPAPPAPVPLPASLLLYLIATGGLLATKKTAGRSRHSQKL